MIFSRNFNLSIDTSTSICQFDYWLVICSLSFDYKCFCITYVGQFFLCCRHRQGRYGGLWRQRCGCVDLCYIHPLVWGFDIMMYSYEGLSQTLYDFVELWYDMASCLVCYTCMMFILFISPTCLAGCLLWGRTLINLLHCELGYKILELMRSNIRYTKPYCCSCVWLLKRSSLKEQAIHTN